MYSLKFSHIYAVYFVYIQTLTSLSNFLSGFPITSLSQLHVLFIYFNPLSPISATIWVFHYDMGNIPMVNSQKKSDSFPAGINYD